MDPPGRGPGVVAPGPYRIAAMETSPLTLNRLSVYLRCLRHLQELGIERVSSQELARRYRLSAAQIRKDLAHFGEFGIRGVGYRVDQLVERLNSLLGLDRQHRIVVVGMGRLGIALARYLGFNHDSFRVVAGLDNDPEKVGLRVGHLKIRHSDELEKVVRRSRAEIGILTVPAKAAESNYGSLVDAGVKAVLNFAPVRLPEAPGVQTKNVDFRIHLEELVFFLLH